MEIKDPNWIFFDIIDKTIIAHIALHVDLSNMGGLNAKNGV